MSRDSQARWLAPASFQNISGLPHRPTGLVGGRLTLRQSRREGPPMSGMGRREFVALLGGAAAMACPLGALAQVPTKRPLVAWLSLGERTASWAFVQSFL